MHRYMPVAVTTSSTLSSRGAARGIQSLQRGFILITVLLFLAALNLLIISSMDVALFETRMSHNFKEKMLAFYQAQNNLVHIEQDLMKGKIHPGVQTIPSNVCGVIFYRVSAKGKFRKAQSVQQSTYMVPTEASHCQEKPKIRPGRQSWRQA